MHLDVIHGLRAKYVEIRALRMTDDRDPRPRMRALAARFPGALRELDELTMETIEARIQALDAVIVHDAAPPAWADVLARYHGWMRVALRLKRAVGRDRELDSARAWIRDHRPAADEPSAEALLDQAPAILRPPGGRLSRFVLSRVAVELGRSVETLEAEAFPPSPMRCGR